MVACSLQCLAHRGLGNYPPLLLRVLISEGQRLHPLVPPYSQLAPFVPSQLNHWCFSKCGVSFLLPPPLCPLHQEHFLHSPFLPKCLLLLQGIAHLTSLRVPVTPFAHLPSDDPFHVVQWSLSSCLCWLSGRENELLTKSFLKFSIMDTGLEHLGPRTNLPS